MKIFVEIPIGTFFSEVFPFWRFAIDNHVFRVFVEVPIGKILALFYVFSATLEGGVKLTTLYCCWENFFLTSKIFWKPFFQYKKWFLGEKYWRSLSIEKLTFLIKSLFFVEKFPNHVINGNSAIFFDCFFHVFLFCFLQKFKLWNIGKMIKKFTFLTKFEIPTYWDFNVNFNKIWKMNKKNKENWNRYVQYVEGCSLFVS